MNIKQIKQAIDNGLDVYYKNFNYKVVKDTLGQYLIICKSNLSCIGLTWRDSEKLNGQEKDFFIC